MLSAGHKDQAAIVGARVVGATGGLESARVKTKLRALGASLYAHGSVPEVADFLGRLALEQGEANGSAGGRQKWPA